MKKTLLIILLSALTGYCYAQSLSVASVLKISDKSGNLGNILPSNSWFCDRVSNIGDLNQDGVPDLAASLTWDNDGGPKRGAFYIFFMNADGTLKGRQKVSQDSGNLNLTFPDNYGFGKSIASLGDLDGDGINDLAVSAIGPGNTTGAVYILFMNKNGTVKSTSTIDNSNSFLKSYLTGSNLFGADLAGIGDINGDGIPDLAVGAPFEDQNKGAVYILNLKKDGSVKGLTRIANGSTGFSSSLAKADGFGSSLAQLGDLDSDGTPDLAVGASGDNSNIGAAYILFLNSDGTVKSYNKINTSGKDNIETNLNSYFGVSMGFLGDYDGDGTNDIIIGASGDNDNGPMRGAAYVVFLTSDGHVKSYQKFSDKTTGISGKLHDNDLFGSGVALLNGKGLAIGARQDDDGNTNAGALYTITLHGTAGIKDMQTGSLHFDIFPNPTSGLTNINYNTNAGGRTMITLTDITGKPITTIQNIFEPAGAHELNINTKLNGLAAGVYFINLTSNQQTVTKKLIIN